MINAIRNILISLSFFPLVFVPGLLFPSDARIVFIRFAILIIICLFSFSFIFKKNFSEEVFLFWQNIKKDKIFWSWILFFIVFLIGVLGATDKFIAFWGDSRWDGFLGMFFYTVFFVVTVLFFRREDYLKFFKFSSISGVVLFLISVFEFLNGIDRPEALIGNPSYLATYFIFLIFCSLVLLLQDFHKNNIFWKWFYIFSLFAGFLGIVLTQTRGAFLGVFLGLVFCLFCLVFKKNDFKFFKFLAKNFSIVCLLFLFLFSSFFVLTKKSIFWQTVPILGRIASVSGEDATLRSRVIVSKISLQAINPKNENWSKVLFGWGTDNYLIAWQKYYDPNIFFYDRGRFEKAHNKILEVLVVNGVLGFLAYIFLWVFFFGQVFYYKNFSKISLALVFFSIAYFVQNLFLFDHIASWIPFLIFLAFSINYFNFKKDEAR